MRPRVVDTSLLFAAGDPDDKHHEKARALLAEAGPAVVPNEVLVETLGLMVGRVGRAGARAFQDALVDIDGIELGHETDMDASLTLLQNFPNLSIVDACAVTLAWRLGCDLDTFDDAQRKVWATR